MPVNYLLVEALREFAAFYGDDLLVEYPTGAAVKVPLREVADDLSRRLAGWTALVVDLILTLHRQG